MAVTMSLAACGGGTPTPAPQGTPEPSSNPVPSQPTPTETQVPSGTDVGTTATNSGAPLVTLTVTPTPCPTIVMSTPTYTPSPTGTATPPPSQIRLSTRAQEIKQWATELGYSAAKVLGEILQHESSPANTDDSSWFSGGSNDPAQIFNEAATRWFWTWIKDPLVINQYGKAVSEQDREAMMYNWIVRAMQSEDGLSESLLIAYHDQLTGNFLDIGDDVIAGSNSSWTAGDGMWSWANAYLYEDAGQKYLADHHRYKYGSGDTTWYIFDAQTVRVVCQYDKNPAGRC